MALFQDRVRAAFPEYSLETGKVVDIGPDRITQTNQQQHRFSSSVKSSSLILSPGQLTLQANDHKSRGKTIEDFSVALDALNSVFNDIDPKRFGIRYINIIDKDKISEDLRRPLEWHELVDREFLAIPKDLADLDDTLFHTEINSPMNVGRLMLRYGLLPIPNQSRESSKITFRFDSDRFVEGSIDLQRLSDIAESFVKDIYSAFHNVRSDALTHWMSGTFKEKHDD